MDDSRNTLSPGDRAIVINAAVPENLGKVVQVVRQAMPGERIWAGNGSYYSAPPEQPRMSIWLVESMGAPFVLVAKGAVVGHSMLVAPYRNQLKRLDPLEEEIVAGQASIGGHLS